MLRGARGDDPTAWTRLVETYGRLIYRWGRRSGLQSADAADVVQETLRSVARGLKDYRHGEPGQTFRGWLYRIAQNKIRDFHRRNQRTVGQAVGGGEADHWNWQVYDERSATHGSTAQGAMFARLAAVEREFSPRNWRIYWRSVVDGQDTADVATEFDVSQNVVRLVKSRVGKRLKELLWDRQTP
jgi:RNA polymerase sigma-70 factor, ECF subfamily